MICYLLNKKHRPKTFSLRSQTSPSCSPFKLFLLQLGRSTFPYQSFHPRLPATSTSTATTTVTSHRAPNWTAPNQADKHQVNTSTDLNFYVQYIKHILQSTKKIRCHSRFVWSPSVRCKNLCFILWPHRRLLLGYGHCARLLPFSQQKSGTCWNLAWERLQTGQRKWQAQESLFTLLLMLCSFPRILPCFSSYTIICILARFQ